MPFSPDQRAAMLQAVQWVKERPKDYGPDARRNLAILIAVAEGKTFVEAGAYMASKEVVSRLVKRALQEGVEGVLYARKPGRVPRDRSVTKA